MATSLEDKLKQRKQRKESKDILVPLIEEFLAKAPLEIQDDYDREFLRLLIMARSRPRKKGVYSPSMLSSCVRQVYFVKTKVKKRPVHRVESSAIFLDGNFRHLKWQFCLWKMHRAGIIQLIDVESICIGSEVWVSNERGDYGGTIDNIVYIPSIDFICIVDWKGMNGNGFMRALAKGPSLGYISQSVGYAGLANYALAQYLPKKIEDVIIIGENKNGAVRNRFVKAPAALKEWRFKVSEHKHIPAARLKKLRGYERRKETPPPECRSTRIQMFKDCPFGPICRAEIELAERKHARNLKRVTKKKKKVQFNRKRNG